MFRRLGEPNWLRIVASCLGANAERGGDHGTAALSQSLVSRHRACCALSGCSKAGCRGKQAHYSIADRHVREMLTNMIEHIAEPDEHDDDINIETGVTS
jgi:hypothetical protein